MRLLSLPCQLSAIEWSCEHFGPQILTSDLVTEPLRFDDFHIHLPAGPRVGVMIDETALRRFARS